MFNKLLVLALICLSISAHSYSDQSVSKEINYIYQRSINSAGTTQQMGKRAVVLLNIFLDSKRQFAFGYSISHLTLAIERSATNPRIEKAFRAMFMSGYGKSWKDWGNGLKDINRGMVKRVHFAYYVSKYLFKNNLSLSDLEEVIKDEKVISLLSDTQDLFPVFNEIHYSAIHGLKLNVSTLDRHFETFVNWEHAQFIQPRIEKLFEPMPKVLKLMLRNVPGRVFEVTLGSIMKQRTTLNLSCFKSNKYLKTSDFLDPKIRITQAREFYKEMKDINFDPSFSCYKDKYYITKFPYDFLHETEIFTKAYYESVSRNNKGDSVKDWLYHQYKDVPLNEFASFPSFDIPITKKDRQQLAMKTDPKDRNKYINRSYHEIGQKMSSCLNTPEIGNWYHFAVWASKSGGEVIDGSKFDDLSFLKKLGIKIGEAFDWTNTALTKEIFSRANNLIALEMIPVGRMFLDMFCGENNNNSFEDFSKKLNDHSKFDKLIKKAFYHYHSAITEMNDNLKIEKIALASTLQVMGEQMRVDDNLDAVFDYEGRLKIGAMYFKYKSTQAGGLEIGNSPALKFPLHKNVQTSGTHSDLLTIELPEYRTLLIKYQLPNSIIGMNQYKKTRTKDWSKLRPRYKFLISMFRTVISSEKLLENPVNN